MEEIHQGLSEETQPAKTRQLVVWLGDLLRLVHRSILVQARARLEAVTIDTVDLKPADAFDIALNNRLDFMNGRAALVDRWRQIQIKADALQSILNVTARGDVRTAGDNPVDFQLPTGSFKLGLEFDAPLTRLLERNDYRRSLIAYQQSRRGLIQSRDKLHLGLRALLRQIEQLRTTLEIQRRAVAIAIRRVDLNRANLYAPVPPPRPGQRAAQFGPTAAVNMLSALSSLRDTQNQFLGVWLNYYAARMRLSRELGMMPLDEKGRWLNQSLPTSNSEAHINQPISLAENLPPGIPSEWQQIADRINSNRPSPAPNRPVYRRNRALHPRPHMTGIGNTSNQYRRAASGPSIPRR